MLDEPTNDLDIETLELLEDLLLDYTGTLLLVSHDRAFLNNVVTSTLVLDGEGRVKEYVGGYDDWQRQNALKPTNPGPVGVNLRRLASAKSVCRSSAKLTYKEQRLIEAQKRELAELPAPDRKPWRPNSTSSPRAWPNPPSTSRTAPKSPVPPTV